MVGRYVLKVAEAQERYALSRNKLMELAVSAGAVRKIGRAVRIDVATMDAFIDSMTDQEGGKTA